MTDLPKDKQVILFDGVCNFCNNSVLKVIKYDNKNRFVFTAIQSDKGKEIINYLNIDVTKVDSIILYNPTISYDVKSSAAIKVMNQFGGFWKVSYLFWVFPEVIRNKVYDFIAKNRYKWFGKKDTCMVPSKEIRENFL